MNSKRFLLLYPPISKKERYSSDIGNAGGEQLPLGIYYIAAWLRQSGYSVKVIDAEANKLSLEQVSAEIKKFMPDFIGISSTTVAFHRAVVAAKQIKKEVRNIPLILGGAHISSNVEHAMSFDAFDYGVIGEGEITLTELINALINNLSLETINGIAFRKNGEVVINPRREYISNLDILPFPAFDLVEDISLYAPPPSSYKKLPVINMITSRGCPNQCTFCDQNIFGRKYRERSAENIADEIKYLIHNFNIKEFSFVDDTFFINKKRIYRLFEILEQEGIHIYWSCGSRINNVDDEFLKFVKSKGCWYLSFGIESGDENILKLIKKNISLEKTKDVISSCKKHKIKTKGFFIIGHPGETIDTINKTIKFACKSKLDDILVTINTPIPGSPQYSEISKYGELGTTDWSEFNYWRPVFIPHGLSREILVEKHREIYRRFYLKPRILFRYFLSFFGKGGAKRFSAIFKASFFLLRKSKVE